MCHVSFRYESRLMPENESAERCFVQRKHELKFILRNAFESARPGFCFGIISISQNLQNNDSTEHTQMKSVNNELFATTIVNNQQIGEILQTIPIGGLSLENAKDFGPDSTIQC